ncbi:MAG TPA: hypothetical protein VHB25_03495 [Gemmatimonadaceae bacterium]|nr:hypothetical protein [Gemmatimonadaceae bacterium]
MLTYCRRLRRTTRAFRALPFLAFAPAACSAPTGPAFPAEAVQMQPPAVYQLWWNAVERCAGTTGDFNAVRFYQDPGQSIVRTNGDSANGYWFRDGNRIVVGQYRIYDGQLVRHEMLHALIGRTAGDGHPPEYFVQKCGGIVHCAGACLTERGPVPTPSLNATTVDASKMAIDVTIDPAQADQSKYDGWITVLVRERNPLASSVWVDVPSGVGITIGGVTLGLEPISGGRVGFLPGETHQQMFDVHLPDLTFLAAGAYGVRGFFASDTTPPIPVTLQH